MPAPVQGPGAAAAMAQAIQRLGQWQRRGEQLDVMVVARGGGSDEDLAAFNDERLARASSPARCRSSRRLATRPTSRCRTSSPTCAPRRRQPRPSCSFPTSAAASGAGADARALAAGFANRYSAERRQLSTADSSLAARWRGSTPGRPRSAGTAQGRLRALSPAGDARRGYAIVHTRAIVRARPSEWSRATTAHRVAPRSTDQYG